MLIDAISVEKLLNETLVEVNIMAGHLDVVVALPGTVNWVRKLKWPGADAFRDSDRQFIAVNNILEGYYKKHNQFALYWVIRAGHTIARDNTNAMDWILQRVTKYNE